MTARPDTKDLTCTQARRALVAYAHGQLGPMARRRVDRHVRACGDCRAALADEQRLAGELRREMPRIGQPSPGQIQALRALWPSIRARIAVSAAAPASGPARDVMSAHRLNLSLNPLGGAALVGALVCAFLLSMMMYTPASAVGVPLPPVPADIQATPMPFTTAALGGEGGAMAAAMTATRTATLAPSLPNAPAAPGALVRTLDAPQDAGRR